jgi:hypothetical protein
MLLQSQQIIQTATDEADKREKLTQKVVDVLLKYVKGWCAAPALAGSDDTAFMLNLALTSAGYTETDATTASSGGTESRSAMGLRFETFAAFMVLHVIGRPTGISLQHPGDVMAHPATVTSLPLWQWTLSTLSNTGLHSQPPQSVALAALSRLSYLLGQYTRGGDAQNPAVQGCVSYVRSTLSPAAPGSCLRAIVTSAALTHPRGAEDGMSAQWGGGIEPVLQVPTVLLLLSTRIAVPDLDVSCVSTGLAVPEERGASQAQWAQDGPVLLLAHLPQGGCGHVHVAGAGGTAVGRRLRRR